MLQEFLEHLGRQWTEALRQRLDLFGKLVQTHLLLDDLWFHLPTVRHRLHTRGWFRTVGEHWHGVSTRTGLAKYLGERQAIGILWQLCGQSVEGRQGIEWRCGQGMRRDLRQECIAVDQRGYRIVHGGRGGIERCQALPEARQ